MIGQEVRHLSYPFGHYDNTLAEISSKIYASAYTTEKGVIKKGQPLTVLPRVEIPKDITSFLIRIVKYSMAD
jgi:hypothetical protein